MRAETSRQIAWECLSRWEEGGVFAETLIDQTAERAELSRSDRAFVQALLFGVLRHGTWLDEVLHTLRPQGMDDSMRQLLWLGLCQIFILKLPEHAAVNETVNLAPDHARGFVNGIMRNAIRRQDEFLAERETLPLNLRYSTPKWLVDRWIQAFGEESTQKLLEWNNTIPKHYVRINPLIPLEPMPEDLTPVEGAEGWFLVTGLMPWDAIHSGALYVADPSTRHAIELLNPQAGEDILDACAAPGGKSAAIIAATKGLAMLTATDLHDYRLPTLKDNLSKQGSQNIKLAQADWSKPCESRWLGRFDAALLDAPCSNSGVIQRRVDVRWRLKEDEIKRLSQLQLEMLHNVAAALKPGGRLVYSTCSIDADEDGLLVRQFLKQHPDFELIQEKLVLPFQEEADGAYCALLKQKA